MSDHIESTADELGTEVAVAPPAPTLTVMPQVQAAELVQRLGVIREAMHTAMERDVDYGVVPGTDKPTLFKPGAEKLSVLFQLDVQLDNEKHWAGDHLTVESKATVFHVPSGARLGFGEGMCSTRERKYAYRRQERSCPTCGAAAVIKGKAEYGGGWLCWKKRNGCGAKFSEGDPAVESQVVGDIDNPDLPDLWNTVVKMAEKRARVDAVLAVTGASALFTQDVEDTAPAAPSEPERRDVQQTGASDVTPADPWVEAIAERVKPFKKDLRAGLESIGVQVPENVGSWGRVLGGLDARQRALFESWLLSQEEAKAGVPWTPPQPHEPFDLAEAEAS